MAFTSHGHHIPGTTMTEFRPESVARCGGVKMCRKCKSEAESSIYREQTIDSDGFLTKAKIAVLQYVHTTYLAAAKNPEDIPSSADPYVVWFSKTLNHFKALITTNLADGMYYEVTYDGDRKVMYLDAYKKVVNRVVPVQGD